MDKVTLYHKTTGEVKEHYPIDAKEILAAEGTEWTTEPVPVPFKRATAPASGGVTELDGLSKAELVELAEKRGVTVTRGDGGEGEPLKEDYLAALS